jgi:hypothetical protein
MLRRDFLARLAAGAARARLLHAGNGLALPAQRRAAPLSATSKLDRISISTWSLHNYFRSTREEGFDLPGPLLALIDFPEMISDKYQVHHFEFCTTHFASTDASYLQEIKYRLIHTRSTIVNMPVDIPELWDQGGLSDPSKKMRDAAVNAYKPWIDIAHNLGVKSVRCDPGTFDPENLVRTVESYKALATYALAKGVRVLIENHGRVGSEHPEELAKLFKLLAPQHVGALPDFGNFPDAATREKGLKLLFPYAQVVCHAKGLDIGPDGIEKQYDFARAMEISKKAGFKGIYSIEYEGPGDPYTGIQRTLDELVRYL